MGKVDLYESYEEVGTDSYYNRMQYETNKMIFLIFLDVLEKSKKCKNLGQISSVIVDAIKKLRENGFIKDKKDEEQYKRAFLSYCVTKYGKEKSMFTVIDCSGVKFNCYNVSYDGKLFFVVYANGKAVKCLEIDGFVDGTVGENG